MKKRIARYFKHILFTLLITLPFVVAFGLYHDASYHYGDNPLALEWENEGPYVFFENDSTMQVNYLKGDPESGFYTSEKSYPIDATPILSVYYPLDSSEFEVAITTQFNPPKARYQDSGKILAISDIESNYMALRDFLIANRVINQDLDWTFGDGHLVLVGDMVDRGYFATQLLWFIYASEQSAEKQGGFVHYIIGNHELKMMYGDYTVTSPKYYHVSSILGKKQVELYDRQSLLGRWMASKNAMELINGNLFVHGGIHPNIANSTLSLEEVNDVIRADYYQAFSVRSAKTSEHLFTSSLTGPCWYRGYFRGDLSLVQVEAGLAKFKAKAVVVGHTLQSRISKAYEGKVFGIDVKHPSDHRSELPQGKSEGLLIEGDQYFRVLSNGEKHGL